MKYEKLGVISIGIDERILEIEEKYEVRSTEYEELLTPKAYSLTTNNFPKSLTCV